jgi:molybdenum cofactor synthesis domain-containing protein
MAHEYIEGDLYQKTELKVEPVILSGVNLSDAAAVVADVLGLERDEVLVIDARDELLTLDLLREKIDPYSVVGKQDDILLALGALPGLTVTDNSRITSNGMLGWVAYDREEGIAALDRSQQMVEQLSSRIARRVVVFSTGPEVLSGQIEDTNKPTITEVMSAEGYSVKSGQDLDDDLNSLVCSLNDAVYNAGYGIVITTGGVGAEDKDFSVEALLEVDPGAATPYIARFKSGHGRHVKDGIRIGVGQVNDSLLFALPGPNDEVRIALDVMMSGLSVGHSKELLAENIAIALREKLRHNHAMKHH